jgi:hypothetical protein
MFFFGIRRNWAYDEMKCCISILSISQYVQYIHDTAIYPENHEICTSNNFLQWDSFGTLAST